MTGYTPLTFDSAEASAFSVSAEPTLAPTADFEASFQPFSNRTLRCPSPSFCLSRFPPHLLKRFGPRTYILVI
eukprot:6209324-Pleurochrysis_carterae.AAC.1